MLCICGQKEEDCSEGGTKGDRIRNNARRLNLHHPHELNMLALVNRRLPTLNTAMVYLHVVLQCHS